MAHEERKTPCSETGYCSDCSTPFRICNTWTITERGNVPEVLQKGRRAKGLP